MTTVSFTPIADSLRTALADWHAASADGLDAGSLELQTAGVARRAEPLVQILKIAGFTQLDELRVLDIGCGFGAISLYLAAHGAETVGVDQKDDRLAVGSAVAREHGLRATFQPARMQDLSAFGDATFDVALQNNSLCYVVPRTERQEALREALRVLKPGGALLTRNPNRWHPRDQFTKLPLIQLLPPGQAVRAAAAVGQTRSSVRLLSAPGMRRELRAAGFSDVTHCEVQEDGARRGPLKLVARYQHFLARRPL